MKKSVDKLQYWSQVFNASKASQKQIKIISKSPDWGCYVCKMSKQKVARPLDEIIAERESQIQFQSNSHFNYLHGDKIEVKLKTQQFPHFQNIKDALQSINVEVIYIEEQFKLKYNFWEIKSFKIYNREKEQCLFSFEDENFYYYGTLWTSQWNLADQYQKLGYQYQK